MPDERTNEITVIVGIKGSGKSTEARKLLAGAERRIVIDPLWEHNQGAIVRDFDSLVRYVRPLRELRYGVVLRTLDEKERDRVVALATAGTPEAPPLPGCTMCIDEIDKMCDPNSIPDSLHRLVNYGRHYRVSLIAIARRPRAMHRDITANADRIIIGKIQEPNDLKYLAEFVGERLAKRAAGLRLTEFVTWPDDLAAGERAKLTPGARPRVVA